MNKSGEGDSQTGKRGVDFFETPQNNLSIKKISP